MQLIADTNILFSFFKKDSITREILLNYSNSVISTEKAIEELNKYSNLIIKKNNINKKEFENILNNLKNKIKFYNQKDYFKFIEKADKISPDKDDSDFLALALKFNIPIWSNDKELKKQKEIQILSTREIIDIIF